jgi:hypothetical protein
VPQEFGARVVWIEAAGYLTVVQSTDFARFRPTYLVERADQRRASRHHLRIRFPPLRNRQRSSLSRLQAPPDGFNERDGLDTRAGWYDARPETQQRRPTRGRRRNEQRARGGQA